MVLGRGGCDDGVVSTRLPVFVELRGREVDVLFDNIVFELQRQGGISLLWSKLAARCEQDQDIEARYVEGPAADSNLFRSSYASGHRTDIFPWRRSR